MLVSQSPIFRVQRGLNSLRRSSEHHSAQPGGVAVTVRSERKPSPRARTRSADEQHGRAGKRPEEDRDGKGRPQVATVSAQPEFLGPAIFGARAVLLGVGARVRNPPIPSRGGYRRAAREAAQGSTQTRGSYGTHPVTEQCERKPVVAPDLRKDRGGEGRSRASAASGSRRGSCTKGGVSCSAARLLHKAVCENPGGARCDGR